jgi:hypothetical protein
MRQGAPFAPSPNTGSPGTDGRTPSNATNVVTPTTPRTNLPRQGAPPVQTLRTRASNNSLNSSARPMQTSQTGPPAPAGANLGVARPVDGLRRMKSQPQLPTYRSQPPNGAAPGQMGTPGGGAGARQLPARPGDKISVSGASTPDSSRGGPRLAIDVSPGSNRSRSAPQSPVGSGPRFGFSLNGIALPPPPSTPPPAHLLKSRGLQPRGGALTVIPPRSPSPGSPLASPRSAGFETNTRTPQETASPISPTPKPAAPVGATKTCDKCNGTGTRSIATTTIGPTTSGNAVCSRCRGRRIIPA